MITRETMRKMLEQMILEEFVKNGKTIANAEKYLQKMNRDGEIGKRVDIVMSSMEDRHNLSEKTLTQN